MTKSNQEALVAAAFKNIRYDESPASKLAPVEPPVAPVPPQPADPDAITLGKLDLNRNIEVALDLGKLMEGRLLIQGASGAGKSWTLRRLLEQSASRMQQIVIDPEGEFKSLADELGHLYVEGHKLKSPAIAEMARRARANRVSVVVDLSDCRREEQMMAVAPSSMPSSSARKRCGTRPLWPWTRRTCSPRGGRRARNPRLCGKRPSPPWST